MDFIYGLGVRIKSKRCSRQWTFQEYSYSSWLEKIQVLLSEGEACLKIRSTVLKVLMFTSEFFHMCEQILIIQIDGDSQWI